MSSAIDFGIFGVTIIAIYLPQFHLDDTKIDYFARKREGLADMIEKESKVKGGNRINYVLLPFTIAIRDDPFLYIRDAKAVMDRKKLSDEAICTFKYAHLVFKLFGLKPVAAPTHKIVSNTTMAFSNVVGPQEEISFCWTVKEAAEMDLVSLFSYSPEVDASGCSLVSACFRASSASSMSRDFDSPPFFNSNVFIKFAI
ncbi:hypothetical protein RJ639_001522 [Escallonia herrerae]|uniref:O-acyltransferase WSD1 C-terminal domain-containing protein n=1 Tax=Escallonia herrerae TaxID=1293975 RepID=A0AA88XAY0_9ASTE|nr:hypothetical protein RJ639_001522 [Escallonia herrerae]